MHPKVVGIGTVVSSASVLLVAVSRVAVVCSPIGPFHNKSVFSLSPFLLQSLS